MKHTIVNVKFLDHCSAPGDQPGPLACEIVGFLVSEDKHTITVATWVTNGDVKDSNSELYVLVKHKGMFVRRLK